MSEADPPPATENVLAVDVGGTSIRAEVHDASGTVLGAASRPTPRTAAESIENIAQAAEEAVQLAGLRLPRASASDADSPALKQVSRAGVIVPGVVDIASGTMVASANTGLSGVAIGAALAERLGVSVRLGHDVGGAGLAELADVPEPPDAVVIIIGTGISSVIRSGGRIVTGGRGQAGELGHVVIRPGGRPCGCGKAGCLETVASASAIARIYSERSGRAVHGAAEVLAALTTDEVAAAVWDEAAQALADAILLTADLLAPDLVIIGGGLSAAGDTLLEPVRRHLVERASFETIPELRLAVHGSRAGIVGAGMIARDDTAKEWIP